MRSPAEDRMWKIEENMEAFTTKSAAKRKREEEQKEAKEKEGRKRRSPRSRKPIIC